MAAWKKAVVVVLAAMVAALPVFAQVTVAEKVQSVLPAGEEVPDSELLGAEGEVAWYLVALLDAGIAGGSAVGIYYGRGLASCMHRWHCFCSCLSSRCFPLFGFRPVSSKGGAV